MPTKVELVGDVELRKALRRFTPDLEKALRKEIAAALRPIVREARGFVPNTSPLSGWADRSFNEGSFPTFNSSIIKSGITYSSVPSKMNSNGFRSLASVQNKSRAGAIYEGAGRKQGTWRARGSSPRSKSRNPQAGNQFVDALPPLVSSLKGTGRLIYRAWRNNQGKAEGAVNKAIDQAFIKFRSNASSNTLRRAA
jgi:hypothetical protein